MFDLGKNIGEQCKPGDLILINGPLGAGKTVLVQGIGAALGIEGITSPTFVISRSHEGDIALVHVDAYRLLEAGSASLYFDDLDLDAAREESLTVIEWGGAESARLSDQRLEIDIDRTNEIGKEEIRKVTISAIGDRWQGFSV